MKGSVKTVLLLLLLVVLLDKSVFGLDVLIVSSSDIIPYTACIEGMKGALGGASLEIENIQENIDRAAETIQNTDKKQPRVVIAVGPHAAYSLSRQKTRALRLFCMVMNPERLLKQENLYPGVALTIPSAFQLQTIKSAFTGRTKVGVFFWGKTNQDTIDELTREAAKLDMTIVPFPITSPGEIPDIISSSRFAIDVLLIIPDDQVSSKRIVEYIIKKSLRRKIPVVGYNSWFAKNGALLSFIIDYEQIGSQTARLAKELLSTDPPDNATIVYPEKISISVDLKTAKKLGVTLSETILLQADEVIE